MRFVCSYIIGGVFRDFKKQVLWDGHFNRRIGGRSPGSQMYVQRKEFFKDKKKGEKVQK